MAVAQPPLLEQASHLLLHYSGKTTFIATIIVSYYSGYW